MPYFCTYGAPTLPRHLCKARDLLARALQILKGHAEVSALAATLNPLEAYEAIISTVSLEHWRGPCLGKRGGAGGCA